MRAIWKYEIEEEGETRLRVPFGAEVISCGLDAKDNMCVWAIVDPDAQYEEIISILAWGTGWPLTFKGKFVGTVTKASYVWHVFVEEGRKVVSREGI